MHDECGIKKIITFRGSRHAQNPSKSNPVAESANKQTLNWCVFLRPPAYFPVSVPLPENCINRGLSKKPFRRTRLLITHTHTHTFLPHHSLTYDQSESNHLTGLTEVITRRASGKSCVVCAGSIFRPKLLYKVFKTL